MGNCATSTTKLVQNGDGSDQQPIREAKAMEKKNMQKKIVRFRLDHEEEERVNACNYKPSSDRSCSKSGALRIKVVVTQTELTEILRNQSKYSSVEHLLSSMKLKNKRVSQVRVNGQGKDRGWRPALESIQEH